MKVSAIARQNRQLKGRKSYNPIIAKQMIVRVRGLALCCIPKNANTSMKKAVLDGIGCGNWSGSVFLHPALNLGSNVEGMFTAAFLRHPAARLVSTWKNKLMGNSDKATRNLEKYGFRQGMDFPEFVRLAVKHSHVDMHIQRQADFLPERLDFLGKVESLNADWSRLQSRFQWLPDLGRENTTVNGEWMSHCDQASLELIEIHYAEDKALWESTSAIR